MKLKHPRSRKQIYRSRSRRSRCRGRKMTRCTAKFGCSKARGRTRRFCRKMHNHKVSRVRMASLVY